MATAFAPTLAMGTLEQRLENWSACQRSGKREGQTHSFEGRYRSPQNWHALGAPMAIVSRDLRDGQLIESAVCMLDIKYHAMLRAWYVRRARESSLIRLARKIGFLKASMREVDECLRMARVMLAAELERPAVLRKVRAKAYVERLLVGVEL